MYILLEKILKISSLGEGGYLVLKSRFIYATTVNFQPQNMQRNETLFIWLLSLRNRSFTQCHNQTVYLY